MKSGRVGIAVVIALTGWIGAQQRAHAGMMSKSIDFIQIVPFFGAEYTRVGVAGYDLNTLTYQLTDSSGTGFAFGFLAGFRLGPIGAGLLYQRSSIETQPMNSAAFNKLYGELGIYSQWGPIMVVTHFDFGWAFLKYDNAADTINGFGGKIGLAVDYYPTQILSIGAGADFDAQGYKVTNPNAEQYTGGVGGTFVARIGLHL